MATPIGARPTTTVRSGKTSALLRKGLLALVQATKRKGAWDAESQAPLVDY